MEQMYVFLQHYWWFIVSLLASLLVFLLFVQGGNTLIYRIGKSEIERVMLINSTGRKWEFTFTVLVTFGGAFFASFPLFYSTSFGGAYWLWMLILFTFVLQAVSYEFQSKLGNLLGRRTYRMFLMINGVVGPLLLGMAVATFFNGADFVVDKGNITYMSAPVISSWANGWHGLDAFADVWNIIFGFAVFFLSRILGTLYFLNNIEDVGILNRCRHQLIKDTVPFLLLFVSFLVRTMLKYGYAVEADGTVFMEQYKYFTNMIDMPWLFVMLISGVALVLYGVVRSMVSVVFRRGIWYVGTGTVLTVLALLLDAGYNGTSFYPSNADLQSSLTIANSSSSFFTLKVMAYVSLLLPFVFAYIFYAWRAIDRKSITKDEMENGTHTY